MQKNLFNFDKNNSSKIEININNRKLSDIKSEEIDRLISVFKKVD